MISGPLGDFLVNRSGFSFACCSRYVALAAIADLIKEVMSETARQRYFSLTSIPSRLDLSPQLFRDINIEFSTFRQGSQQILFQAQAIIRRRPQVVAFFVVNVLLSINGLSHFVKDGSIKEIDTARDQIRDEGFRFLHIMQDFVGLWVCYKTAKLIRLFAGYLRAA